MAFNSAYTLLSVSWETQFLSSFFAILLLWMYGESEVKPNEQILNKCGYRPLVPADGLRALIFLTLVHCAFFGTGNVASIASFYLAPVYRLVPVFNPGIMSVLLMFKLIIPYLLLGSVFAVITHEQKTPPFAVILLMLAMTEREWHAFLGRIIISFTCCSSKLIPRCLFPLAPLLQRCASSSFSPSEQQVLGSRLVPPSVISQLRPCSLRTASPCMLLVIG